MAVSCGQVLPFRVRRQQSALTASEADARAREYIAVDPIARDADFCLVALSHPDVLLMLIRLLRGMADTDPRTCADESERAYAWLETSGAEVGVFDERDYFLGEFALIAGGSNRHLGHFEKAEMWLDRAEASFTHTISPAPNLANVGYARLTIHYDRGRYDHVLSLGPALLRSYERLEMPREWAKCKFVIAMAQKMVGRREDCLSTLQELSSPRIKVDNDLRAQFLLHLAEMLLAEGQAEKAVELLAEGSRLIDGSRPTVAFAHLHGVIGEALSRDGRLAESAEAYRVAVSTFRALGFTGMEAYSRLALAQTLLQAGDARQAEWEVLAALPAINEQGLEAEAKAAISMLYQSARSRKTDIKALGRVRDYLKAAG